MISAYLGLLYINSLVNSKTILTIVIGLYLFIEQITSSIIFYLITLYTIYLIYSISCRGASQY